MGLKLVFLIEICLILKSRLKTQRTNFNFVRNQEVYIWENLTRAYHEISKKFLGFSLSSCDFLSPLSRDKPSSITVQRRSRPLLRTTRAPQRSSAADLSTPAQKRRRTMPESSKTALGVAWEPRVLPPFGPFHRNTDLPQLRPAMSTPWLVRSTPVNVWAAPVEDRATHELQASSRAAVAPQPGRRPPELSPMNSIQAESSSKPSENTSKRSDHFQVWGRRNPLQLRPPSPSSKGTTSKLSTQGIHWNLRKSIPTTVAFGMSYWRFSA